MIPSSSHPLQIIAVAFSLENGAVCISRPRDVGGIHDVWIIKNVDWTLEKMLQSQNPNSEIGGLPYHAPGETGKSRSGF